MAAQPVNRLPERYDLALRELALHRLQKPGKPYRRKPVCMMWLEAEGYVARVMRRGYIVDWTLMVQGKDYLATMPEIPVV